MIIPVALLVLVAVGSAIGDSETESDATSSTASEDTSDSSDSEEAAPQDEAASDDQAEEEPAEEPAVRVTATQMIKDFESNELAGDAKYKDKRIRVSGKVNAIDTNPFDENDYILQIGGGGEFEFLTVNCNGLSADVLSTLEVGQDVTAVGDFDDGGDLGVELADCEVVR